MSISAEELKRRVSYDPETGVFTWLTGRRKGKRAGGLMPIGYRSISFNRGRHEYEHRLAFLYMLGQTPHEVDHIDRVKSNNVWVNLRAATRSLQLGNTPRHRNNTSGFKGVYQLPGGGRWRARIGLNKQYKHLGLFDTAEAAYEAYCNAAKNYFGEYFNSQM